MPAANVSKIFSGFVLNSLNRTHSYMTSGGRYASRSKKKIIKLHGALYDGCELAFGDGYEFMSFREDEDGNDAKEKEYTLNQRGAIRPIRVDVAVLRNSQPVLAMFLKNVDHNYDQNAANYFNPQFAELEMTLDQGVSCIQLSFMRTDGFYHLGDEEWSVKTNKKGKPSLNGMKKQDLLVFFRDYENRKNKAKKLGWDAYFDQIIIPTKLNPEDPSQLMYASYEEMRPGREFKKRLLPGEEEKLSSWAEEHTNPEYIWKAINHAKERYEKQD